MGVIQKYIARATPHTGHEPTHLSIQNSLRSLTAKLHWIYNLYCRKCLSRPIPRTLSHHSFREIASSEKLYPCILIEMCKSLVQIFPPSYAVGSDGVVVFADFDIIEFWLANSTAGDLLDRSRLFIFVGSISEGSIERGTKIEWAFLQCNLQGIWVTCVSQRTPISDWQTFPYICGCGNFCYIDLVSHRWAYQKLDLQIDLIREKGDQNF